MASDIEVLHHAFARDLHKVVDALASLDAKVERIRADICARVAALELRVDRLERQA
jgi:hypothetical protein